MRLLPGDGVEYGTSWVIERLVSELTPIDLDEVLSDTVRECYAETTKVAWAEFDTVDLLKTMDPVAWRCALADESSRLLDDEQAYSPDNGSTLYWVHDIERLLEEGDL